MRKYVVFLCVLMPVLAFAQKKPLDHSVYDSWKAIGERLVSNDGAYVAYTINPQEGDGELVIQNPQTRYKRIISRGYSAVITEDSKYLLCKIKPPFKDTRQARIKKKKPDEMPKDSFAIIELGEEDVLKKASIKSFQTPEKGNGFVALHLERPSPDDARKKLLPDSVKIKNDLLVKIMDSLIRISVDSIKGNISREALVEIAQKAAHQIIKRANDAVDADGDDPAGSAAGEGTDLVLRNLKDGREILFKMVTEFLFDKQGNCLLVETGRKAKDSNSTKLLLLYHLKSMVTDTLMRGFHDAKNYVFDEAGRQLCFVAERDSSEKALQKFYKLYSVTTNGDSAKVLADKNTAGMQVGFTVSEHAKIIFSRDGSKLYFGNAPIRSPKDTTLVDFETAKVDIWHYQDDYLQTQQLKNLDTDLKRSYTAVYHFQQNRLLQLGTLDLENITLANEGNAEFVLAETNKGNRVAFQWTGRTLGTAYIINTTTGVQKLLYHNLPVNAEVSPGGKFVYWFNPVVKHYFTYEVATGITRNISERITTPLYDEENDVPDLAASYGTMGWQQGDSAIFVYEQFGFWKLSPLKTDSIARSYYFNEKPQGQGVSAKVVYRYLRTDREERFFVPGQLMLFNSFNKSVKANSVAFHKNDAFFSRVDVLESETSGSTNIGRLVKAKYATVFCYSRESYTKCPDLYISSLNLGEAATDFVVRNQRLSDINPQQNSYNWGTAALYHWKAYNGKNATGILYKPEDYDAKKKYPMICYFYEKLSDGLNTYIPPAPTPSRLNISFFVSRGYIVLAPDIIYSNGHPGKDAYKYVVSGARALVKQGLVDSARIGIQGQSWGGYQVAYLVTSTNLFKAAWTGAPVANMTSAYGGIRWESGLNRQFQYEKQQSRIGASLWEKPQLYIENSPLFHLPNVKTPLVIMHNDADGAVPWYQGIELFTGLKRLGKPVWMLNYNGEAHNLIERKNRKDIQIREQQFFDWQLQGTHPAKWLKEGVPATEKGKDWGLELE